MVAILFTKFYKIPLNWPIMPKKRNSLNSTTPESSSKKSIRSELCTVMMIDIVGYSKRTNHLTREEFSTMHDDFDSISKDLFSKYNGVVIKKIGDAFLTKFHSATDALYCAVELQIEFNKYSAFKKPLLKIPIRVSLHSGDVIKRGKDLYGDTVNTVARIESITKCGDIVLSEAVFQSSNQNNIPFRYIGPKKMKGLKYPVKLFLVKKPYQRILNPHFGRVVYRKVKPFFRKLFS